MSGRIVGRVQMAKLDSVKPNTWNPNEMTASMMASLKQGFLEDGWLISESLLIWRTNKRGTKKNIIIDGEQRWTAARELDLEQGPMVFLDGLSEIEAKAQTIKLDAKRGKFNTTSLGLLVKELNVSLLGVDDLARSLGFTDESLARILQVTPIDLNANGIKPTEDSGGKPAPIVSTNAVSMQVPIYMTDKDKVTFNKRVASLKEKWGTDNTSETIMRALREARQQ